MNLKNRIKTVATNVAIAFFFSAIFVLCYYYVIEGKISTFINLINTTAVKKNSDEEVSSYNFETNKLLNYPKYGKKFATLKIDSIDLSLPVYHGDTLKLLRYGAGHFAGSYFPGENGTIILAAHNTKGFFDRLDEINKGDKVIIDADYAKFEYKVYDYKIVKEN